MKKVFLVSVLMNVMLFGFSQKVVKMYYTLNHLISLDHQVDPKTGVENGYYKKYNLNGRLEEDGFYKMGRKNGTWKQYNNYGKVTLIANYKNDTLNGIYKEWCNGDSYLCNDLVYKNGEAIKEKTYYTNGNLEWDIDKEKDIYNQYSIKGEALTKTINGKHYHYTLDDDGKISDIDKITFDSAGKQYKYSYGIKYIRQDNSPHLCLIGIAILENNKQIESFMYYPQRIYPTADSQNNNNIEVSKYNRACLLYNSDPNPISIKFNIKETEIHLGNF